MRVLFHIGILISVLFLPWWITALSMVLGVIFCPRFYEVVIYGLLYDVLYGTTFGAYGFMYVGTIYSASIFFITLFLRTRLSF